jgi:hypothetical protein
VDPAAPSVHRAVDLVHRLYRWKIIPKSDNSRDFSREAPELVVNQPAVPVRLEKLEKDPLNLKTIYE